MRYLVSGITAFLQITWNLSSMSPSTCDGSLVSSPHLQVYPSLTYLLHYGQNDHVEP